MTGRVNWFWDFIIILFSNAFLLHLLSDNLDRIIDLNSVSYV